jgi:AcrR family transcriptional regulator
MVIQTGRTPARTSAPAKTKRAPLTEESIVLAAIDLIDRDGFSSFSMRKLGAALGVQAMSLYEHCENKDAILIAVRSHFYRILDVAPPVGTPWYEELRAVSTATYQLGVKHPSYIVAHLHAASVPESRHLGERNTALLRQVGFSEDQAAGALIALVSYVIGFLHRMVLTTAAVNPLAHKSRDNAFQLGLDAILHGLRALAGEPAHPGEATVAKTSTRPAARQLRNRAAPVS